MNSREFVIFAEYYSKGCLILRKSIYNDGRADFLSTDEFLPMLFAFARRALIDAGKDFQKFYKEVTSNMVSYGRINIFDERKRFYSMFLDGKKQAYLEFIIDVDFERDNEIECVGAFCDIFRTITRFNKNYFDNTVYIEDPIEDLYYRNTTFKSLLDLCIDLYNDLL